MESVERKRRERFGHGVDRRRTRRRAQGDRRDSSGGLQNSIPARPKDPWLHRRGSLLVTAEKDANDIGRCSADSGGAGRRAATPAVVIGDP